MTLNKRNKSAINWQQNESSEEPDSSSSSEAESELECETETESMDEDEEHTKDNTPIFYQERLNRLSLCLRFPKKLDANRNKAESKVKLLNKKIINVRIPRQKYANYCLVDFANIEDKKQAYKELRNIRLEEYNRKLHVTQAIPNNEYKLEETKKRIKERREAKQLLTNLVKNIEKNIRIADQKNITPQTNEIIIQNLPIDTSELDIKKIFPNAYDISIAMIKNENDNELEGIAYVTLPTPKNAKNAVKGKFRIKGTLLKIIFSNSS